MTESANRDSCSACGSWWKLPLLLAVVLAAILLNQSGGIRKAIDKPAAAPQPASAGSETSLQVALTIHAGDVRQLQHTTSRWHEGMTVADLLQDLRQVSVVQRGSGETAFVTELNGIANEGAGGRNWLYSVNGKRADRSFGAFALEPNDHVLWIFAAPE